MPSKISRYNSGQNRKHKVLRPLETLTFVPRSVHVLYSEQMTN